jgi:cytochrome P450
MTVAPSADTPRPPAEFSPAAQDFIRDPYPMLKRMREECPVWFSPELGFWGLMRYDDIDRALVDHETFTNGAVRTPPIPARFEGRVPADFFAKAMIAMDPPEHTRYRKVAQQGFTRGRMRELESPIREIANSLIDSFIEDGHCEFMGQFAYALTLRTIMLLMDLPPEEMARMRLLAEDFPGIVADGIDPMPEEERNERWGRMVEVRELFARVVDQRRADPGADIVSRLATATDEDGGPLFTTQRIVTHMSEFVFAGTDTTANTMAFTVMLLDADPAQRAEVVADPARIPNLIEEVLRRKAATVGIFKMTSRDVEIRGVTIPAGSLVWCAIASAGHDPERFPSAESFDIHRANAAKHLTFGKGRHLCLGAPLSRAEAKVGLEVLLERIPDIRVVPGQEPEFQEILLTNVMRRLDVEWGRR